MYRKAGIIVGLILIGIALAVVMITNGVRMNAATKPVEEVIVDTPVDESTTNSNSESSSNNNSEDTTQSQETVVQTPVQKVEQPVVDSKNVYLEYNDSKLKDLRVSEEITEVMVVSSKKVVLLDPANLQDYQFVHACEFLTSSNHRLTYFISSSTYDSIEIGEQLQVTYKVYTNANKLDMPVIVKVDRLNK